MLAKDAAMTQALTDATVTTTAYNYEGQLDYGQVYFWRVMALEPAPSDWSATFSFHTQAAPAAAPIVPPPPSVPTWVWVFIALGIILIIAVIVLIFRMRRR